MNDTVPGLRDTEAAGDGRTRPSAVPGGGLGAAGDGAEEPLGLEGPLEAPRMREEEKATLRAKAWPHWCLKAPGLPGPRYRELVPEGGGFEGSVLNVTPQGSHGEV